MAIELNKLFLSRYIIYRHLASGGMADVYEANDVVIKKPVALKFLKSKYLDDAYQVQQFENEARSIAIFNNPHIMRIYNVGIYEGQPFVSYELLRGKTLKEVLDNRGRLSYDEAIDYMLQIVDAVSHIHEKEIIHNDLKPDNIFVLSDGNIKICDFGISSHINERNQKEAMGSILYLAPEVLQNRKLSVQSDIYSLGVMLFEFLTGHLPFFGRTQKEVIDAIVNEEFPSLKRFISLDNVDDLDYVINKASNRLAINRYKSIKEFASDLKKIKNHTKVRKGGLFARLFK